jgi:hypothetical protein
LKKISVRARAWWLSTESSFGRWYVDCPQLFYFLAQEIDVATLRTIWQSADLGIASDALERALAAAVRARKEMKEAGVGQFTGVALRHLSPTRSLSFS